jgi:amino acid adenylation domain-containing protein
MSLDENPETIEAVAIVGAAGRFPGAADVRAFWRMLCNGTEAITFLSEEELLQVGVPLETIQNPHYVRGGGMLEGADLFDSRFFGYTPREADFMDPQQRLFLECAWHALEDAAHVPESFSGSIGVYAGCGMNQYILKNLAMNPKALASIGDFQAMIGNDKDFIATRTAYKLNLKGPALTIQTACSTSLVAVQVACQSLLSYQCDMALAGGACVRVPLRTGYLYQSGMILSPDGHCRAFDEGANGTVWGEGVGVVVLRRLSEALEDGDRILAVIKGAAINNDGSLKAGFTAPSVDGQAEVVAMAQAVAEFPPETIGYIEAHGTGTPLGDPIEIAALRQVFHASARDGRRCAIGSVKTNIGHLDAAAGVAGLIKAALALYHKTIPPTLHFQSANPKLELEDSPFFINDALRAWEAPADFPRRAGVSAFGIGGTNAHVVLEEAPLPPPDSPSRDRQLVLLSARDEESLSEATLNLARFLDENPHTHLPDLAFTLQVGRRAFRHRAAAVCESAAELSDILRTPGSERLLSARLEREATPVAFLFSGQGSQYIRMGAELYETEPVFREALDHCAEILEGRLDQDIRLILFPEPGAEEESTALLNQTAVAQPALFAIEYAVAQLWMFLGIEPRALIGHSVGEYAAACLAGVFSLEDALVLVALRGKLMGKMPSGAMLAVPLSEEKTRSLLPDGVCVAAVNAPQMSVVSGSAKAIREFQESLKSQWVEARLLHTSHAFHSAMMEPVAAPLREALSRVVLHAPRIPVASNLTGRWLSDAEAVDPDYWVRHMLNPVRFLDGVQPLLEQPDWALLEVGPGNALCSLVRLNPKRKPEQLVAHSIRHPKDKISDQAFFLQTLGRLWLAGVDLNWGAFYAGEQRARLSLPGYPFQRKRHWIDPAALIRPEIAAPEGPAAFSAEGPDAAPSDETIRAKSKGARSVADRVSPGNELQAILVDIWRELLGIEDIGVHDDFFELGGHSLLAAQIVSRIRETTQVEIQVGDLFENPTIAKLAENFDLGRDVAPVIAEAELAPRPRAGRVPLSSAQKRLWFIHQLEPDSPAYNIVGAIRLSGKLNDEPLRRAFEHIYRRHESLRASFPEENGAPVGVIRDDDAPAIEVLRAEAGPAGEKAAMDRVIAEALRPFDIAAEPLVRPLLIHLSETEHVFAFVIHHIISDGWSLGIFTRELAALYDDFLHGRPASLTPLPIQYSDYVVWQEEFLETRKLRRQIEHWREKLGGEKLPVLQIPTDRPRPPVPSYRGSIATVDLDPDLSDGLREMGRGEGATLFMVLLAAFQTLLHRYSRQETILVGSPIANRNRVETENLIGFFLNMLPLKGDFSGKPDFQTLLRGVRKNALDAYANQDLPFERLVEILQPERDMAHHPLFQVMFAFQNYPIAETKLEGLSIRPMAIDRGVAQLDLSLYMWEEKDRITGFLEYSLDIFDPESIRVLVGHFKRLLRSLVQSPGTPVLQLDMITDEERRALLVDWNRTARDYPREAVLHALIEERVAKSPGRVAAEDERPGAPRGWGACPGFLSFDELNRLANRLAHGLIHQGVGPGKIVGVHIERSLDMLVAVLGVLKAGAAYLPLDPYFPEDRLAFMVEDAEVGLILTQRELRKSADQFGANLADKPKVFSIDADWAALAADNESNPGPRARPEDLAYVIYTSGSTGKPKGVPIHHRAFVNFLFAMLHEPGLTEGDVVLSITTLSFDISTLELFLPLVVGARTIILDRETAHDGAALIRALDKSGATVLQATPATWRMMLDSGWTKAPGLKALCGGEALPAALARSILQTGAELWNLYGPTETTVWCSVRRIGFEEAEPAVGGPIANTQFYIVDEANQLAPLGIPGELAIGGNGVARGYLHREELTRERFIPNPFPAADGAASPTLYMTGDLVRRRMDGGLDFLGRLDNQVKVRGYRIELGEIETALLKHPLVRQAVVAARPDKTGENRLAAWLIAEDGKPDVPALREFLGQSLPDYMIPSAFLFLKAYPLTPNGKIDRRALPEPDLSQVVRSREYVAPRNRAERTVAEVWREILNVERIGVLDNFFELGGHSLLATRLVSRLRDALSVQIPLRAVFENPTVSGLVERMNLGGSEIDADTPPLTPRPAGSPIPISSAQKRLWFIHQLEPESPAYNIVAAVRLLGDLDEAAFKRAFQTVCQRHEILRCRFPERDGNPVVRLREDAIPDIEVLTVDKARGGEAAALKHIQLETFRHFDLANGPLIRPMLIHLSENEHIFAFVIHHIIADGWSLGILTRELGLIHNDFARGLPVSLPPLPIQYGDYVAWQEERLRRGDPREQIDYWKKKLGASKLPVLQLPADRPRLASPTYRGAISRIELPPELSGDLNELARREGATLFMVLLAAFQTLLHRYSRQETIVVGSPIANRYSVETEQLIGFFINMLPLKGELGDNPRFRELLLQVRQTALDAYANQDLPFERMVEVLQPERDMTHHPLFQVMFAFQNYPIAETRLEKLKIQPLIVDRGVTQLEISLYMWEEKDRIAGLIEYSVELFDPSTIEAFVGHFQALLAALVRAPETRVLQLDMISERERRFLVHDLNQTARDYPRQAILPTLLEAQAAKTPARVAASDEKGAVPRGWGDCPGSLSFAELHRLANRLAHGLIRLGVGPETIVGVHIERSLDMLVAVLAIHKAGGAYVPLDPYFPEDRLAFMIEDSGARLVLTQQSLRPTAERLVEKLPQAPPIFSIDADWNAIASADESNPAPRATAENLAYVIYTSGSTGKPKGVPIHHRGLVNFLFAMLDEPGLSEKDVLLSITTLSFDISILELFLPPLIGARIVILGRDSAHDGNALIRALGESKATVLQATPATWRMMLDSGWTSAPGLKALCGGEALSVQLSALIMSTGAELWNLYGPTETTVWSSVRRVRPEDNVPRIGGPIANTQYYVLDDVNQPAPLGVPGELMIAGDGVARGYLNREELTRDRFVANPFARAVPASSPTMYRTGDLVRLRPDGSLDFLGRMDNQVKIRGYRIELGEIEATLVKHHGVRQAVVAARLDKTGENRLAAWIIPEGEAPDLAGLREFLRQTLPEYMIPSAFAFLEAYPLTPSGKIDRRALPEPDLSRIAPSRERVEPRNRTEKIVAKVWSEILNVEKVGVLDNFFELGGHSLMATRMVARVRELMNIELPLRAVFEEPTVEGLARRIAYDEESDTFQRVSSVSTWNWECLIPMQPQGSRPPFFLVAGAHANEDEFLRYLSNMIAHIGLDQPVYGFRPRGLDGVGEPHASVEAMAQDYLKEMLAFHPGSPYLIGGECVGGIVAYEMAQQLVKRGKDVALLLLMDTPRPVRSTRIQFKILSALWYSPVRYYKHVHRILKMDFRQGLAYTLNLLSKKRKKLIPLGADEARQARIRKVELDYPRVLFRYNAKPYPGKLTFIVNEQERFRSESWQNLPQGGMELHVVPGNHITRLTKHARVSADKVLECVDRAVQRSKRNGRD